MKWPAQAKAIIVLNSAQRNSNCKPTAQIGLLEGVTANMKMVKKGNYPGIWGIPLIPGNLGNFPNTRESGEFPKYPGIWGISQIPGNLGNFPNTWESGKFPKYLGIWGIFQIPGNMGNFPILWNLGNFPNTLESGEFRTLNFLKNLSVVYFSII